MWSWHTVHPEHKIQQLLDFFYAKFSVGKFSVGKLNGRNLIKQGITHALNNKPILDYRHLQHVEETSEFGQIITTSVRA